MDTAKWPQARKARPEKEVALNCPRCNSLNTKFCYYNNYSLTQPRYFCKDCRRYWTEGGSLRNIPIGGGIRKNKPSSKKPLFLTNNSNTQLNPKITENADKEATKAQDLAFSQEFLLPSSIKNDNLVSTSSALELLGISNYTEAESGFGLSYPQFQEFMRPSLGFCLDGGDHEGSSGLIATSNETPLLQFESLKLPVSSSSNNSGCNGNDQHSDHDHDKEEGEADQSVGFWNSMLSAGTSAGSWQ